MRPPDPRALFDEHAAAVWELARRVTTSDDAAAGVFVGTFRAGAFGLATCGGSVGRRCRGCWRPRPGSPARTLWLCSLAVRPMALRFALEP